MPPKKGPKEPEVNVPEGDASAGRDIFDANCSACHAIEGDSTAAPVLGGIVGRKAGAEKFAYSKSMKNSGIVWTDKHLFAFLKNPSKHVSGTKMAFAGLPADKDRADLIAYLKSV
ncbi:hypothetical protein ABPG74_014781 [Tetrahymena malaccensis]